MKLKRWKLGVFLLAVALIMPVMGFAQQTDKTVASGPDWSLTLGYKLWLNTWQQVVPPPPVLLGLGGNNLKSTEAFGAASIPSATLRFKNFFLSTGVLIAPEYHFDSFTDALAGLPLPLKFKITGARNDVDVTAGYSVFPAVALLIGYKGVFQRFRVDITNPNPGGVPFTQSHNSVDYHGLTLGASIAVPIPDGGGLPSGFGLYVNGGGGPMWASISNSGASETPTAIYGTIDGGVTYRPAQLPVSLLLGYKYQGISNKVSGKSAVDVTRGATFGASYTF